MMPTARMPPYTFGDASSYIRGRAGSCTPRPAPSAVCNVSANMEADVEHAAIDVLVHVQRHGPALGGRSRESRVLCVGRYLRLCMSMLLYLR